MNIFLSLKEIVYAQDENEKYVYRTTDALDT